MNKKTRNYLLVLAVAIVIIVGLMGTGTILPKNPNISKVFSVGNTFTLSTVPQMSPVIRCQTDNSIYYVDTSGSKHVVDDTHHSIIPYYGLVGLDISSYATGNRISTVGGTLTLSCAKLADTLQLQLFLTGKFVTMTLSGLNSKGQSIPVYSTTQQITSQTDINGKSILVMQWTEPASAIYNAMKDPASQYTSWITAHYDYEFDFVHGTDPTKFPTWRYPDLAGNADESLFRVLIQNPTPTPSPAPLLGQDVKLTLVSPTNGVIDLTKSNRFFQTVTTLSNWHPEEDYPILNLYHSTDDIRTANPIYIWKLTSFKTTNTVLGSSTDFAFNFNLPPSLQEGDYKLFAQSAISPDGTFKRSGTDVAILHLIKPAPPICTTLQTTSGYTIVNGVCTAPPTVPIDQIQNNNQSSTSFDPTKIFTDFTTCISSGNYSCLNNSEFIPIFIVVFLLFIAVIASARSKKT